MIKTESQIYIATSLLYDEVIFVRIY